MRAICGMNVTLQYCMILMNIHKSRELHSQILLTTQLAASRLGSWGFGRLQLYESPSRELKSRLGSTELIYRPRNVQNVHSALAALLVVIAGIVVVSFAVIVNAVLTVVVAVLSSLFAKQDRGRK